MLSHYLITRFNIVQGWYKTANRNNAQVQTDEWLTERFRLFENYCLPSVASQTCSNFKWIILFNSETPKHFMQKIAEYKKQCPLMRPVYLQPYGNEDALLQNIFQEDKTASQIITTRLDNDDMISPDFIRHIQNCVTSDMNNVFLNCGFGYQYDTRKKLLIQYKNFSMSHYVSRVVFYTSENIKTVMVDHSKCDEFGDYIEMPFNNSCFWIESVHSCNAWNRIGGGKPVYKTVKFTPPNVKIYKLKLSLLAFVTSYSKWFCSYCSNLFVRKFEKHVIKKIFSR